MPSVPIAAAHAPFILVIDVGSSSLRAMVYDAQANEVEGLRARRTYQADATDDGGLTLDPHDMFEAFTSALDQVVTTAKDINIAAVSASSLAYNVLALDANGEPVTPAFIYSDTRDAGAVEKLRAAYDWSPIYSRTGCPLHTSYLPARLVWLRETQPDIFSNAAHWVSLYEYFLLRLFGCARQSHSFAAWSGMLNHATLDWDEEVLQIAGVRREQFSPLAGANDCLSGLWNEFAERWKQLAIIPWFPAFGDGALANIGSGCFDETSVAVTVGTSGAMRVVMDAEQGLKHLPHGLWMYRVDERAGLVGGSLNNGGNIFAYLSNLLQIPDRATLEAELEAMSPDAHGLTMLPFFAGERSPGYRGDARATLTGWNFGTSTVEIWRAAIEAVSYRFALIYQLLREAIPPPQRVLASGGALIHSRAWVQILADVLGVPVTASGEEEASARGAALMALRALGVIQTLGDIPAAMGETFAPRPENFAIYARARERQKSLYHLVLERE
ncbi:MAG TPA: gluconokinase [Anaerolineae bacterium]|nr:gluconokinase [Anaerolineae bacterium]